MTDLVWWTILAVLLLLLLIFCGQLCYSVIRSLCFDQPSKRWPHPQTSETVRELEDLTSFKNDFRTALPKMQLKSEVDGSSVAEFLNKAHNQEVKNEVANLTNGQSLNSVEIVTPPPSASSYENLKSSVESFERVSEGDMLPKEYKEIYDNIQLVRGEAEIYARQIPFFLGSNRHLQYYEINEKFILCLIQLGAIECDGCAVLQKKKSEALAYVQQCQNELKKKAEDFVF